MGRDSLGELEHQVLLAILQHDGESYSVPIRFTPAKLRGH